MIHKKEEELGVITTIYNFTASVLCALKLQDSFSSLIIQFDLNLLHGDS